MAVPSSEDFSPGNIYPNLSSSPDVLLEYLLEPPSKTVQYQDRNPTLKEVKKCLKENIDSMTRDIGSKLDGDSLPLASAKPKRDNVLLVESVEDEGVGRGARDQVEIYAADRSAQDVGVQDRALKEHKYSFASSRDVKVELEDTNKMDSLMIQKSIKTRGLLLTRQTLHSRTGFRRYINRDSQEGSVKIQLNKVKSFAKNVLYFCDISRIALKKIEGSFGSSVTSYFVLLKHLITMNLFIMLVQGLFVITPQLTLEDPTRYSLAASRQAVDNCMNTTGMGGFSCVIVTFVVPIFTGEGWFDTTPLFIGAYSSDSINPITNVTTSGYHMPSAFLYTYISLLFLVTVLLAYWVGDSVLLTFTGLKQETGLRFATILFSSWDYNITKQSSARARLKINLINLIELHHEYAEQKDTRSCTFLVVIYLWRVFTWLTTLLLLLAGCFLIVISPLCGVLNIIHVCTGNRVIPHHPNTCHRVARASCARLHFPDYHPT